MTDVITGPSPSETALSESAVYTKSLCDYVVNVADGCLHGCTFCFNRAAPQYAFDPGDKLADAGVDDPSEEWGEYALYREDLPQHLEAELERHAAQEFERWRRTDRGQGVVMLSLGTDPYMTADAAAIAGEAIEILAAYDRHVRVLTRDPKLAAELHGDLYRELAAEGLVTVGSSIPGLDERAIDAIEQRAPSVQRRLAGLANLQNAGVPVFVSMSPTYPTQDEQDFRRVMEVVATKLDPGVVFHEPINPRGGNIQASIAAARDAGEADLARALEVITDTERWRDYALQQLEWAQEVAMEVDVPVHLWPDEALVEAAPTAAEREWLVAWRERRTPEGFGPSEPARTPYPTIPNRPQQRDLDDFLERDSQ